MAQAQRHVFGNENYEQAAGGLLTERSLFNIGFYIGLGLLVSQIVMAIIFGAIALIIIMSV